MRRPIPHSCWDHRCWDHCCWDHRCRQAATGSVGLAPRQPECWAITHHTCASRTNSCTRRRPLKSNRVPDSHVPGWTIPAAMRWIQFHLPSLCAANITLRATSQARWPGCRGCTPWPAIIPRHNVHRCHHRRQGRRKRRTSGPGATAAGSSGSRATGSGSSTTGASGSADPSATVSQVGCRPQQAHLNLGHHRPEAAPQLPHRHIAVLL
jgi:hypothetical protein